MHVSEGPEIEEEQGRSAGAPKKRRSKKRATPTAAAHSSDDSNCSATVRVTTEATPRPNLHRAAHKHSAGETGPRARRQRRASKGKRRASEGVRRKRPPYRLEPSGVTPQMFLRHCLCCGGAGDKSPNADEIKVAEIGGLAPKDLVQTKRSRSAGSSPPLQETKSAASDRGRTAADDDSDSSAEARPATTGQKPSSPSRQQDKKDRLKQQVKKFIKQANSENGISVRWLMSDGSLAPATFRLDSRLLMFFSLATPGVLAHIPFVECERTPERISLEEAGGDLALRLECQVEVVEGSAASVYPDHVVLAFDTQAERERFWSCVQVVKVIVDKRNQRGGAK